MTIRELIEDQQAYNYFDTWVSAGNVIEMPEETYNLMRTL